MPLHLSPAGGYRRLDSWALATIAQLATYRFCRRFLTRAEFWGCTAYPDCRGTRMMDLQTP